MARDGQTTRDTRRRGRKHTQTPRPESFLPGVPWGGGGIVLKKKKKYRKK